MKTEQLKALGLDETQIAEVFKLNGAAIEKVKKQFSTLKEDNINLRTKVGELELKLKEAIEPEAYQSLLDSKEQLEGELSNIKEMHSKELESIKFNNLLDNTLKDSGAKSLKAVKALINMDEIEYKEGKLEGIDNILENLQKEYDYLFHTEESSIRNFTTPSKGTRNSDKSLLAKKLSKYD